MLDVDPVPTLASTSIDSTLGCALCTLLRALVTVMGCPMRPVEGPSHLPPSGEKEVGGLRSPSIECAWLPSRLALNQIGREVGDLDTLI